MRVYQFRHVGISTTYYAMQARPAWCPRRDSNPHTLRHMDLNHARLPIPPRGPGLAIIARRCRRIPLRYQALPICARPTFIRSKRRLHLRSILAFGWAVCEETESIADDWQMSKAQWKGNFGTLGSRTLGEYPGPPLHYACQGVNPTNIALPESADTARTSARHWLNKNRKRFEAPNLYHSKPRGDSRRFPRCQGAARQRSTGTRQIGRAHV